MNGTLSQQDWCVIIPTYNNSHALADVIEGTKKFTSNIIVVNDGSTDHTKTILDAQPGITVLTHQKNQGKGKALQDGFRYAIEAGYRYAITIDSDGQHFPDDIPALLEEIIRNPDSMIVGARNMEQEQIPGTSNFGHNFSIFWFKVETGLSIPDVQTGYRLYPLKRLAEIRHFFTPKYEFEVEILVRLAWRKVPVSSVPVKVYYAPKEIRVSHFRKFRDFTRVSITNATLVFIALLWVRPISFFRSIGKKPVREFYRQYVINSNDSNIKLALSVALGLFIGVAPIWGWQILTTLGLSHIFKLNKFVAVTVSNISLPPMLPFIIFVSYILGGWIPGAKTDNLTFSSAFNLDRIADNLIQYVIGSFILGTLLAMVFGTLTYILLKFFRKHNA